MKGSEADGWDTARSICTVAKALSRRSRVGWFATVGPSEEAAGEMDLLQLQVIDDVAEPAHQPTV